MTTTGTSSASCSTSMCSGGSIKSTLCCVMQTVAKHNRWLYLSSFGVLLAVIAITTITVLPVPVQMVCYTLPILHIGSHLSLKLNDVDEDTGERVPVESVTRKDAMLFPLIGSGALVTLYLLYKFLSAYWVNLLLALYLTVVGVAAIAETIYAFCDECVPKRFNIPIVNHQFDIPSQLHKLLDPKVKIKFSTLQLLCYIGGLVLAVLWLATKHWVFHNILAVGFSIHAIRLISVGNFSIATILLCGLFVYDIFWVFGTEVMVTVAKSFEGPAKIIFPVSLHPFKQSILGLGDVVIPGVFIAMILRFDKYRSDHKAATSTMTTGITSTAKNDTGNEMSADKKEHPAAVDIHARFPKCYYVMNMVAYQMGLMTTTFIMYTFKAAQPALLYLVPFCLSAVFGPALYRGDMKELMSYTEEDKSDDKQQGPKANGTTTAATTTDTATASSSSTSTDTDRVRSRKPQKD